MNNHKRFHRNCITTELINVARMNHKQASIACDEANRLGLVGKYTLSDIIRKVGPMSAAAYDMAKAAQTGFKDNNQNSIGPDGKGVVPDKKIPISSMGDSYSSCLQSLQSIGISEERSVEECSTQWKGEGSRGGGNSWYTTQTSPTKQNAVVSRAGGGRVLVANKIKSASERINKETHNYYSKRSATRNASVSPNVNEVPSWITVSGGDTSHLVNAPSNIKNASTTDQMYNYMLVRDMSHRDDVNRVPANLEMEKLVERHGRELSTIAAIRRIKSGKKEEVVDPRPKWVQTLWL